MSPDDRAEAEPPKEAEETEDRAVGSSIDRAGADADGLDALADGLTGFAEGESASEPDDEIDLGALAAVAARPSAAAHAVRGADGDARVRMAGLSSIERHSAKLATATSAPAPVAAVAAPVSRPAPPRVSHAYTDAPLERPRSRAPWVMPLIAGLGLGVGLAGVLFGMTANRPATPSAALAVAPVPPAVATAVPQAPPQAAAAMRGPADEAPPTARPTTTQPSPAPMAAPAPRSDSDAPQRRVLGSTTVAREAVAPTQLSRAAPPTSTSQGAVLSLRPVVEPAAVPAKTALDSALDAADQRSAKTPASRSSVDSLLDEALAAPAERDPMRAQREAALAQDALPQSPSREDVTKAMTVLLPAIRGCAMGQSGLATASIVVRADGRVAGVEVAGAPFSGTASGRCMEGVIRRAQFTRFKQPIFRIKFPFAIQ